MIMRRLLLILLYGMIFLPVIAKAEDHFPDDVAGFFHDADLCQYLAGEWDNTLPRKRTVQISIKDRSILRKNTHRINWLCKS